MRQNLLSRHYRAAASAFMCAYLVVCSFSIMNAQNSFSFDTDFQDVKLMPSRTYVVIGVGCRSINGVILDRRCGVEHHWDLVVDNGNFLS